MECTTQRKQNVTGIASCSSSSPPHCPALIDPHRVRESGRGRGARPSNQNPLMNRCIKPSLGMSIHRTLSVGRQRSSSYFLLLVISLMTTSSAERRASPIDLWRLQTIEAKSHICILLTASYSTSYNLAKYIYR